MRGEGVWCHVVSWPAGYTCGKSIWWRWAQFWGFPTYDRVIWTCQSNCSMSNYWGGPLLVRMLIGDNWSHVEATTFIYGQCRPHSNPADVLKSPRKARNVTRFSVGYIRLGMRLGVISPNPWATSRNMERPMKLQSGVYWTNAQVRTSTSIILLKVMLWNSL